MENSVNDGNISEGILLGDRGMNYLLSAAKWARFLAIVGFVMIGLLIVFSIIIGVVFSGVQESSDSVFLGGFEGLLIVFIYGIMALIYFFPTLYLYRFATRTRDAIKSGQGGLLEEGIENLAACFKFIGVLMVIVLVLYGLGFGIALLVGITGML